LLGPSRNLCHRIDYLMLDHVAEFSRIRDQSLQLPFQGRPLCSGFHLEANSFDFKRRPSFLLQLADSFLKGTCRFLCNLNLEDYH
jgi:hypothetical protein